VVIYLEIYHTHHLLYEDKVIVNGMPNTSIVTMDIEGTIPKAFGRRTIEII
jgi:hypothetical protein